VPEVVDTEIGEARRARCWLEERVLQLLYSASVHGSPRPLGKIKPDSGRPRSIRYSSRSRFRLGSSCTDRSLLFFVDLMQP